MARAGKVCSTTGCPAIVPAGVTYCIEHARAKDAARGRRQARGYDASHERERKRWAPTVATGTVHCWRCRRLISPAEPWHLGHLDDRTGYGGPEHVACNTSAGGRASHQTGGG